MISLYIKRILEPSQSIHDMLKGGFRREALSFGLVLMALLSAVAFTRVLGNTRVDLPPLTLQSGLEDLLAGIIVSAILYVFYALIFFLSGKVVSLAFDFKAARLISGSSFPVLLAPTALISLPLYILNSGQAIAGSLPAFLPGLWNFLSVSLAIWGCVILTISLKAATSSSTGRATGAVLLSIGVMLGILIATLITLFITLS